MGSSGGIGSAIKEALKEHSFDELNNVIDWAIYAQGSIDESDVRDLFEANTLIPISLTQRLIPNIKKGVIFISSTAGITSNSMFPVYAASKAALNIYAQSMAKKHPELQFCSICPGPTDTKMWRSLNLPGKAQDPSEVAKAVRMAIEGAFQSGDIITVRNGEISCQ